MTQDEKIEKLITLSSTILESLKRLERIAMGHMVELEEVDNIETDLNERLSAIEAKLTVRKN